MTRPPASSATFNPFRHSRTSPRLLPFALPFPASHECQRQSLTRRRSPGKWGACLTKHPSQSQSPAPGTELAVGSYVIEFTASDVSENTSICAFELTVAELGLNALFAQSLSIAPNPASESLVVSNSFAPMTALRLFDVVGKQIRIFEGLDSQSFTIDVTPLTPGIYFLTINEMVTKKIIIH